MSDLQPIGRINPVSPSPSLLTSSRDRTADDFGSSAPVPAHESETGELAASTWSWRTGISWTPASCQPSYAEDPCPDYAEGDGREAPSALGGPVGTSPVMIYTPLSCDWATVIDGAQIAQDAVDLTEAHLAYRLSRTLWLGDGLPDTVTVNGVDVPPVTLRRAALDASLAGGAGDLDDVVGALLQAYVDCTGGSGGAVLHVPGIVVPAALGGSSGGARIAWPEGNLYRGPLGSIVSPGPGYPHGASIEGADGYGPILDDDPTEVYSGNDADEVWVYVTGPVEYARSPIMVLPERDEERRDFHRRNTYEVWAQRQAIVRFDPCCVFAALATNPLGDVS